MGGYQDKPIGELAKELAAGLLRLRQGYIDSAEALMSVAKPPLSYPYEFVVYRLTGYRPRRGAPLEPMDGRTLRADLQRLIFDICDSFDLAVDAYQGEVFDTPGLARKLHVSTKTIQRWRRRGLVARKLVFPDGKKRIAFLESSVEAFASQRSQRLLRSARFSQLTDAERAEIVHRANRIVARTGSRLHEVSRHLARRMGRAVETIRYTIRGHDRENPADAVYRQRDVPLGDQAKEIIYRCFLHGVPVTSLADRFGRTRGSIYRIINEMRARQLLSREIDYVYNPQFDLPGAEEMILGRGPEEAAEAPQPPRPRTPDDLPPYLRSLYDIPLLRREEERQLFQQYNYVKYRADQLRRKLDLNRIRTSQLRRIERMLVRAETIKNWIIRANLRLVVSIAKKHLRGPQTLFELISDGNISLMRAVEKFDYARGCKLSTYASWAIMKNFARSVPKERYLLDRFVTGADEMLELAAGMGSYDPHATSLSELRESLEAVLAQLTSRERSIIVHHYGLDDTGESQTLDKLSRRLGISKERVRQIERRAMDKLRTLLQPDRADLMR